MLNPPLTIVVFLMLTVLVRSTHLIAFVPRGAREAPLSFDPLSHRATITGKKQEQEKKNTARQWFHPVSNGLKVWGWFQPKLHNPCSPLKE